MMHVLQHRRKAFSGGGIASPLDIAGCKLWLKADGLVYHTGTTPATDGETVSTWVDESGSGFNATDVASVPPTFETNELNGKPVIGSALTNRLLRTASLALSQPFTIFGVLKLNGTGDSFPRWFDGNGGAGSRAIIGWENGTGKPYIYAGAALTGASDVSGAYHVESAVFNGASSVGYIDGQSFASGDPGSSGITTIDLLSAAASFGFVGSVAEVIIYNTALSTGNRQAAEDYLGAKYCITVTH